jgi:multicomponent Na+:H+ antiporter subunit B
MRSVKLEATARVLQPLILFFSVFVLLEGHDAPGGGFVGGLTAAAALVLHGLAYGHESARRALPVRAETVAAAGLLVAASTAVAPLLWGRPLLTAAWTKLDLGDFGALSLGTPLLFDVGVYLVVLGGTLMIVLTLGEE